MYVVGRSSSPAQALGNGLRCSRSGSESSPSFDSIQSEKDGCNLTYASFRLYLLVPSRTATRSTAQPISTIACSTIALLVSCSCSRPTKFLRLAPSVVCHQQCPIVLHQSLLQLILRMLVNVFLVVCHYRLSDCLTDSIDLRCVAAARNADPNVDIGEFIDANDEERLVDLRRAD